MFWKRGIFIKQYRSTILLALLFAPGSTIWSRAIFSAVCAILGTWVFVWFIQQIKFRDVVMVLLIGIMFGNVVDGITARGLMIQDIENAIL